VWEELSGGLDIIKLGNKEVSSRAYCGSFNFKGADQQKKVGQLSGGERNRVNLAKMLKSGANVLLLDEPTNDLDLDTLRILEDFLDDWPGAAVVVSHDRTFLERSADRVVAVHHDGSVAPVAGGVAGWISDPLAAGGTAAGATTAGATTAGATSAGGEAPPAPGDPAGSRAVAAVPAPPGRPPARRPSSHGRRLRELEKEMARRQRLRDELTGSLAATTDHRELARLGAALTEEQARLDEAEEEWLLLAEEAEGSG